MDTGFLLMLLFFATIAIVIGYAVWSKAKVEERNDDPEARKSTLAVDAPDSRPGEPTVK